MLAWLLDPIAGGLSQVYGRPLGHDVAVVFLLAFVAAIVLAVRWSAVRPTILGAGAPLSLVRPPGLRRAWRAASTLRHDAPGRRVTALGRAAFGIAVAVNLVPLGLGASLVGQGEPVRGAIYAALGWLWVWFFVALLPVWFLIGWYEYGFWLSLLGNGLAFLVLSAPEWLLIRANRAAKRADDFTTGPATVEGLR
jgi:hypothetical protein